MHAWQVYIEDNQVVIIGAQKIVGASTVMQNVRGMAPVFQTIGDTFRDTFVIFDNGDAHFLARSQLRARFAG